MDGTSCVKISKAVKALSDRTPLKHNFNEIIWQIPVNFVLIKKRLIFFRQQVFYVILGPTWTSDFTRSQWVHHGWFLHISMFTGEYALHKSRQTQCFFIWWLGYLSKGLNLIPKCQSRHLTVNCSAIKLAYILSQFNCT